MKRKSLNIKDYTKNAARYFSYTRLIIYTVLSLVLTIALIISMVQYQYQGAAFLFNAVALFMIAGYFFLNIKALITKYKDYK